MKDILKNLREELEKDKGCLDGWCHYCALKLAKRLDEKGFEPVIVWGAVEDTASSVEELEKNVGGTHFWVSIRGKEKCLDIYSNESNNRGDLICKNRPPGEYYEYARIEYKNWMEPDDFISYKDFKRMEEKNVVINKK